MHQKDDRKFVQLLNRLHICKHNEKDLKVLAARTITISTEASHSSFLSHYENGQELQSYDTTRYKDYKIIITVPDLLLTDISSS